ncbi:hypothetical protein SMI01S_11850 [Sphingobacterium mizutaii NBRC 14946 = DSM 11724]|uniref:Uncharacterized protein n=1 Tax=Sphingobacterium mizutaii NBRC 14946 = DSM 11724 TaxID=1220576 RepID=A0ABQ0W0X0_9SPHI|nr:hypothetical protein SMI01S_11850 [Sphingobacterium mizutaii NBRC 14946 = DSM 11724]
MNDAVKKYILIIIEILVRVSINVKKSNLQKCNSWFFVIKPITVTRAVIKVRGKLISESKSCLLFSSRSYKLL